MFHEAEYEMVDTNKQWSPWPYILVIIGLLLLVIGGWVV